MVVYLVVVAAWRWR